MKMEDAIAKLVVMFGTEKEQVMCDKITAVMVKAVGNRDVPDGMVTKLVTVGNQLKRMGVT